MADVDLRSKNKNSQKKTYSVATAHIKPADGLLAANVYQMFNLPAKCLITNVKLIPIVDETGGEYTADVGYEGADELLDAAPLNGKDTLSVATVDIYTDTGKTVTLIVSDDLTDFEGVLIVEFIEYALTNGNLLLN